MFKTKHQASELRVQNMKLMGQIWWIVLLRNQLLCNAGSVKHLENTHPSTCATKTQQTSKAMLQTNQRARLDIKYNISSNNTKKPTTLVLFG